MFEGDTLAAQAYTLVKHCGFSYSDVRQLTYLERADFLAMLKEENERRKEEMKKIQSKGKR